MNPTESLSGLARRAAESDGRDRRSFVAGASVCVAMCTCNGGRYLGEQLTSILGQTRQPDEIVICDDGSTDDTLQILERFSKEAPFPVREYRNEQRLGATKNFEKAISLCTGEIIFLSDQDDVWMPGKIEKLEHAIMGDPHAGYVFSDALVVDETLRPVGYTMWQLVGFTAERRRWFQQGKQLEILLNHNVVTGATMAFRAALRDVVLPIAGESIPDEWVALLASSLGMHGVLVEQPLIQYRQHPQQLLGGRKVSFGEKAQQLWRTRGAFFESRLHQEEVSYSKALDRLVLTGQLNKHVQQLFDAKIQHLRVRQSIHKRPHYARFFAVSREFLTLRYNCFSLGWKSAARDLLL